MIEDDDEYGDILERELAATQRELTSSLFHYTSSDAGILGILGNRAIRMSPFDGTNDLWESRPLWLGLEGELPPEQASNPADFSLWDDIDLYIRGYSKVACFTQDWKLPDTALQRDALRGWSHLSMWAHYGAGHSGVCLRFDRELLIAAFEKSRGKAVHQFHGAVRYRGAESGVGPHSISLAQAAEFGLDAVALQYANVHRNRVFFRKHADWTIESEFRLVRTDLSIEPHYIDISDALTGIVLGDAFPQERVPALLAMLEGFEKVEIMQARFFSRTFQLLPWQGQVVPTNLPRTPSAIISKIVPRHNGDLSERLIALENAERVADIERENATEKAVPVLRMWSARLIEESALYSNWPDVVFTTYNSTSAVPPEERRKRPGVEGETVAFEAGLMVVGEHQPQFSFTWAMAIALQLMPDGGGRLHACITTEEWKSGGNSWQELYRDRRDTNLDEVVETSSQMLTGLFEAIPDARSKFDELRGKRGGR